MDAGTHRGSCSSLSCLTRKLDFGLHDWTAGSCWGAPERRARVIGSHATRFLPGMRNTLAVIGSAAMAGPPCPVRKNAIAASTELSSSSGFASPKSPSRFGCVRERGSCHVVGHVTLSRPALGRRVATRTNRIGTCLGTEERMPHLY